MKQLINFIQSLAIALLFGLPCGYIYYQYIQALS